MKINATEYSDYLFTPRYSEQKYMVGIFSNLIITPLGRTFPVYQSIPDYMIKGGVFLEKEMKETTTVRSKTDFLNKLDLYVDVTGASIQKKSFLKESSYKTITDKNGFFEANHIPQIFYPFMGGYISSIDGEFDFVTGVFKGHLEFSNEDT